MTGYARSEREALCDRMLEAGPDAPTLCDGWRVRDLAAHLVLRERRPDAAVGILVRRWRPYTDRVQRELCRRAWPALVDDVRSGPPLLLRPLDELVNVVELYVHHEDVRRAEPGSVPRTLEAGEERALWARLKPMARLARRKLTVGLTLVAPGFGSVEVRPGEPRVTLTGSPGELLLVVSGRLRAAHLDVSGPADAVSALEGARLGL